MRPPAVIPTRSVIGKRVMNEWGVDLGRIEDVVINPEDGQIAYAAMQYECSLGRERKLFALPWQSLVLHPETGEFILDVPRDVLEEAPGFDPAHWPETADPYWGTQVYTGSGTGATLH